MQKEQRALEQSVNYSPMNNYDHQDLYQAQGHTNSTSRKSNTSPRHRQESEKDHHYSHRVIDISSPMIESRIAMGTSNYSRDPTFSAISTEQPVPPRKNLRRSLDANRFEQQTNAYVEPPKPNSGAYRAPVPSLPFSSAQQQQSSTFMTSSPLRSSFDSPAVGYYPPPPPGSTALTSFSSSAQDPHNLWKETTLRNANNAVNAAASVSATAAEGRKGEPAENRFSRSESIHSQNSRASSTYSSSGYNHNKNKGKPISGSTFATSLSPSLSNASQSSFKHRNHNHHHHRSSKTNNAVHPDGNAESSRLNSHQTRMYLQSQQIETSSVSSSENASTLSLPGSRYLGDNSSFRSRADDESIGGGVHHHNNTSISSDRRHASEISLAGSPVSAMATGVNTPSLAGGVRTPIDRRSQYSSS
ncbi:hypothetical protein BGZ91_004796, partial [Linnemannia elongata]